MAGSGYHPEGHQYKLYEGSLKECRYGLYHVHVICRNCAEVCPDPEGECIDDC